MLQAALGAIILLGIYKFMNSKSEYEVNGTAAFVFILGPGFLIFLLSILLAKLGINPLFTLVGYVLYFLLPFAYLKYGLEYQNRPAFNFAIVVPVVAILTEIPFVFLLGAGDV